jgi:hypothetical protein
VIIRKKKDIMDNPGNDTAPESENRPPETLAPFSRRRQRREARRAARGGSHAGAWTGGIILIGLGIVFLAQNLNLFSFDNWWAVFILIPAVGAFGAAWRNYQEAGGRLTAGTRASLFGGLILTMIAAAFLFNLEWTVLGPVFIILVGVGILVNTLLPG